MAFSVTPASISIKVGQKYQLTVSPSSGGVKWGCTVCNVASVNGAGVVTGIAPGSAEVSARRGNVIILIAVTVTAVSVPVPPPAPPTAKLQVTSGVTVVDQWAFSTFGTVGAASNPIVTSQINYGDGTIVNYAGAPPVSLTHTFASPATYHLVLSVVTQAGLSASAVMDVVVSAAPAPPAPDPPDPPPVPIAPVSALTFVSGQYVGHPFTFSSVGTGDNDGVVINYTIDYGDGASVTAAGVPPLSLLHVYANAGMFTVTLTVTDNDGQSNTVSIPVTVQVEPTAAQPPIAALVQQSGVFIGDTCVFSTVGSVDPDGTLVSGSFTNGNGQTQTWAGPPPATLSTSYQILGTFSATVTVVDNTGLSSSKTVTVTISAAPQASVTHPRVWITGATRPALFAKIQTGGVANAQFKGLVASAESVWANTQAQFSNPTQVACAYAYIYQMMLAGASAASTGAAFVHTTPSEWGDRARDLVLGYIATYPNMGTEEQEYGMVGGYDWAFDRLTPANKVTFADWIRTAETTLVYHGNPFISNEVSVLNFRLIGGLVLTGDGIVFTGGASADTWAAARIAEWGTYWRGTQGVTRSRSFLSGVDGAAAAGRSYEFGHTNMRMFRPEEAYRTVNGISRTAHYGGTSGVDDARGIKTIPQFFAYSILPWAPPNVNYPGGRDYRFEKGYYMPATSTGVQNNEFMAWLQAVSGAYTGVDATVPALAQWLLENRTGSVGGYVQPGVFHWFMEWCLYGPSSLPVAQSPTALGLPTNRQFTDGNFIFRQDWTSPNASYVTFAAYKWIVDAYHSPYHNGSFQVHRNGPALILGGGASGHDYGSGQLPGSNNTWRFTDRTVTSNTIPDDMGESRLGSAGGLTGMNSYVEDSQYDIRGRNAAANAPELRSLIADGSTRLAHYVYADLTRTYQSDDYTEAARSTKITTFIRQFAYFPAVTLASDPDVIFLFDRATVKTGGNAIRMEMDLHTSGEPLVSGQSGTDTVTRGSHTHARYLNATLVSATNAVNGSNNAVFIQPIRPAMDIVKVWGPNGSGQSFRSNSHDMEDPYGVQWATLSYELPDDQAQYVTRGRVELHPHTHADTNYILTCVEVHPSAGASAGVVAGGETATMVYARYGSTRWVAFPIASSVATTGTFLIRGTTPGSGKLVIAGLLPGAQRTLTPGANISIEGAGAGVAYNGSAALVGASGSIELDVTFSADGAGAANTVTIS